jgi:hypothetical protein
MAIVIRKQNIFWITFPFIAGLAVAGFTYSHLTDESAVPYLLSAVSQSLAAIFTLVFAITIFGAQTMKNFTAIDRIVDTWTKILMVVFAIGIILPLIHLSTNEDLLNIRFIKTANLSLAIDLGIATFCVLIIIPYLIRINRIMKYERGISRLSEELSDAIDSGYKAKAISRIKDLSELCLSAVDEGLQREAIQIIGILKNLYQFDHHEAVLESLEQIGSRSKEKKLGDVLYEVLETFTKMGEPERAEDLANACGISIKLT